MNDILSEKDYQKFILTYLKENNGYVIRKASEFDRLFAVDRGMLFQFLNDTQPDAMKDLQKIFKNDLEETIVNYINNEVTKQRGSLVATLKNGIEVANLHLDLMYTKPATTFNSVLNKQYGSNIFSVMEEVWASDQERIDLVIFLNGLAIMSFELKCNAAGQSYEDAIRQYRTERNLENKVRLFRWKAGCIVNFAMDLEEVYMTTKLCGNSTFFMPFNRGRGEGVNQGAGNPQKDEEIPVSYMWEDILTKDTILDLISKFIFIETKDEKDEATGKTKHSETVIFPRYHQLDLIRHLLSEVTVTGSSQNYLIEHSPGSGKTNSIAWLTYRLASLHDTNNKIIFDNIIIVTDRVVVDRQLQKAILGMDHKAGLIKVMDDKCTSADLKNELQHNTKIIATTIQKFPYIVDSVSGLKNKTFAVIIDEAHSSTAGKNMQAVTNTLASEDTDAEDAEDMIVKQLEKTGKQPNLSVFAFTATPKPTTLRRFGRLNTKGQYEACHIYSMKQAIEEGYILDVLANYVTYKTMYKLNKAIADDPELKTNEAKRQIARFLDLHDTNITQRIEVIIEHFRLNVMNELGGMAKAMVVTDSRAAAVKYCKAFRDYIARKGYNNIQALVAFSGKVKLDEDDTEYSESGMNGFSEDKTPEKFDSNDYNVMIVANKYQTGFDQKKLCAMYICKKLKGVNAVQTLSRLNRICPGFDKKVFVLDFSNKYEDIEKAFEPYYTTTLLSNDLTPKHIYDLEAKIDGYDVIDPLDIERVNELLFKKRKKNVSNAEKQSLLYCLRKIKRNLQPYTPEKQREAVLDMRAFVRFYDFLMQVSCLDDKDLHKKYQYIRYALAFLSLNTGWDGFDLKGKIRADNFMQIKSGDHKDEKKKSQPIVKLATASGIDLTGEEKEKLSKILEEINSKTGKQFDLAVTAKSALQVIDLMRKSKDLTTSAKNNTESDFEFSFYSAVDKALVEGLSQNEDFFQLLLSNEEIKKEVLGIFISEIYKELRGEDDSQNEYGLTP